MDLTKPFQNRAFLKITCPMINGKFCHLPYFFFKKGLWSMIEKMSVSKAWYKSYKFVVKHTEIQSLPYSSCMNDIVFTLFAFTLQIYEV